MKPDFPERLLREAEQNPNGWVYEIDSHFDPDGRVPVSGIIRAWRVSAAGKPTGELWINPDYVPVTDT